MSEFTFSVKDSYNVFGAGHRWILNLYRRGRFVQSWEYDAALPFAQTRLRRKIVSLASIYGATREGA